MVRGITCYVGPRVQGRLRAGKNLDDGSFCPAFKKALLEGHREFRMTIQVANHPPMTCQFGKAGETAGVAGWIDGRKMLAVTTYLAGIDPSEECASVAMMLASKPLPITLHQWHKVLETKPPIYGTFMFTAEAYGDDRIATAVPALANSFLSLLGAVEDEDAP